MEQYIKKSALIVEIERLIDEIYAGRPFDSLSSEQQTALWYIKSIMSSINTLEVKEVDLEKELNYDDYINFFIQIHSFHFKGVDERKDIFSYFYATFKKG